MVSPVHIKKDSLTHNIIAHFVKMDGKKEDYTVSGDVLNNCGIRLKQNYASAGFDSDVRFYQDFCARLYIMEKDMIKGYMLKDMIIEKNIKQIDKFF